MKLLYFVLKIELLSIGLILSWILVAYVWKKLTFLAISIKKKFNKRYNLPITYGRDCAFEYRLLKFDGWFVWLVLTMICTLLILLQPPIVNDFIEAVHYSAILIICIFLSIIKKGQSNRRYRIMILLFLTVTVFGFVAILNVTLKKITLNYMGVILFWWILVANINCISIIRHRLNKNKMQYSYKRGNKQNPKNAL